MSGMDRLTDETLEAYAAGKWKSYERDNIAMARELLALRLASQATPTGTELQPCPFCGGEADTMTPEADDMRAATVMCMGCYCTGKECETKAQAIAAWNRRASQAAPAPSDGLLEAAIAEALNCLDGEPEYHENGMGCGLEDRNITDRYEVMAYGWNKAMERIFAEHINPAIEALTPAPAQEVKP